MVFPRMTQGPVEVEWKSQSIHMYLALLSRSCYYLKYDQNIQDIVYFIYMHVHIYLN